VTAEGRLPPESDRALGMGFYLSRSPGVPGRLKATDEEFRVREVSTYPRPDPDGPFTVLRLESRGWEQHELADAVARQLGLPRRSVAWSGTKDRRAVSERLFSYRGRPPSSGLALNGVTLLDAYPAREGLVLGHHYANAFDVRVSGVEAPAPAVVAYREVESELRREGGFPNFFGGQRFGEVRPVTHEVGRRLVRGDLVGAIDAYLIDRPAGVPEGEGDAARDAYGAHRDPKRALAEFPAPYRFERSILERLARGDDPDRALRALPFELRRLFVHAYQSHLFNRYLTRRHEAGVSLARPSVGDAILRLGRDGTWRGQDVAPVSTDNLAECDDLVRRGRAQVAGPLVGISTELPTTGPLAIVREILDGEGIGPASFGVPVAPELASRGTWRPLLVPLPPLVLDPDASGVWFRFALPKGTYATVLLREFLKDGRGPPVSRPAGGPGPSAPGAVPTMFPAQDPPSTAPS